MNNNGIGAAPPYEIAGKPRAGETRDVYTAIALNQQTADERWAMLVKWTNDIDRRLNDLVEVMKASERLATRTNMTLSAIELRLPYRARPKKRRKK